MKKRLRENFLKIRDSIPLEQKVLKEAAIEKRLFALDIFIKAKTVLMYVSFRSEVDTQKYLQAVISLGKKLILPVVDPRNRLLNLYEVRDASELAPGYMGIPEPCMRENREVSLNDIDIIILPGAGFDIKGNRLGYGGGYYDKLLSGIKQQGSRVRGQGSVKTTNTDSQTHQPLLIALAFEEQISEKVPSEPHDIKVDMIITDKRLVRCADN